MISDELDVTSPAKSREQICLLKCLNNSRKQRTTEEKFSRQMFMNFSAFGHEGTLIEIDVSIDLGCDMTV